MNPTNTTPLSFKQTLWAYIQLMRLNRPVGIYLVLWPALWALWLGAGGFPGWLILSVFVSGAVLMRSAGCVINDYADRHFDGHVARTCQRPIAAGLIKPKSALVFFLILCLIAFGLVLLLNPLTISLSLGAVLLAALYPFMKRFTYWPQAFLGAAFAWAVPMGFAATANAVPWQAWPIFIITLIWALIYDTAYAIGDKEDDLKIGVKSTAILFGERVQAVIGVFQILMLLGLIWIGHLFALGWVYHLSLGAVAGLFLYHQKLLGLNQPSMAFKAFLNNHWVGFVVLLGIAFDQNLQSLGVN
ncbi:4-hydroxybenzoate octaprenyltransferase [Thiosulfativibrio zosterae]|uniref:4-hydroxybenzoate octaprenyltransferase n=1 Tax=Thiosulfativibrio zosterae TaxID=2675053 RepID=A0A6F8PK17_9GAMM|nr:4-hydroxybenzoate octaprenyltransferase [Thiosulfativibrio zosterae]BBP42404.1 4-hydroxybenzoate octaprenyltransferase [Thiosulfativibrio zosterae]